MSVIFIFIWPVSMLFVHPLLAQNAAC